MARKSSAQLAHEKRLTELMNTAGIYEPRYELQIEMTAETICEINNIKSIINKEGRTVMETKTGGIGVKTCMHPLYIPLNQTQQLLLRQMASLGLNKLNAKKEEAASGRSKKDDPMLSMISAINCY